jgi:putative thiamine transport system permease protein
LPTQWLGAGRWPTVTTEAVTLASGGQRHTAAAFAVLQALLPVLGFAWAALIGRRQALKMV